MITVSDAWKDIQQRFLLPETFVEIDCTISEVGAEEGAVATGTNEAVFSDAGITIGDTPKTAKYATNELNLWALDGSRSILPSFAPYGASGYVSNIASTGSVTLSFPAVHSVASSGLTITWSSLYGEYPSVFTVTAKNGDVVVAETTVTDNRDKVSAVFLSIQGYDSITVTVHDWGLPHRRARIEKIVIGHVLTFTKNDIISFKHEQHGDLLSGELPKYSIEFTLDNTDGRWNPNNPTGMEQYLSERQKLVVRYGMDVNGTIEWIPGGVFYLSEWDAPSSGLEARFVARDGFEFLMGDEWWGAMSSKISYMVTNVTRNLWPSDSTVSYDTSLNDYMIVYSPSYTEGNANTAAEIVQRCANAACAILRCDRKGNLYVEPLNRVPAEYIPIDLEQGITGIPLSLSYSYPEITLSKPLREVSVDYGGESSYIKSVAESGERQTLSNDFIRNTTNAEVVATWVADVLKTRKTISGEFRADPRLDLYDVVRVEDRYGVPTTVVITSITYTYNGSFRGSYEGRVLEG